MEITKTIDGSDAMLSVSGRLDTENAPRLAAELDALNGVVNLVLDFEQLEFISSLGLREVVRAQKKLEGKGSFALIRVPLAIKDAFRLAGLYERFRILS